MLKLTTRSSESSRHFSPLPYTVNSGRAARSCCQDAIPASQPADLKPSLAGEPKTSLRSFVVSASGKTSRTDLSARLAACRGFHYAVPRAIYQLPKSKARYTRPRTEPKRQITLIRFTLNTVTLIRPVLPALTDTLLVADKLRAAALAWYVHIAPEFREDQRHPREPRGREADDLRVTSNDHAFFWPTDEDDDGLIYDLSVFCPSGLAPVEVDALRRLLRIRQRGGRPDLLLTLVFIGQAESFATWKGSASTFISATPELRPGPPAPRKIPAARRGRSGGDSEEARQLRGLSMESDLIRAAEWVFLAHRREAGRTNPTIQTTTRATLALRSRACMKALAPGFATGLCVDSGSRFIRALAFCRKRRQHIVNGNGRMLQLEFATPRPARPFSIGAQAHFGLGLFVPLGGPGFPNERMIRRGNMFVFAGTEFCSCSEPPRTPKLHRPLQVR